MRSNARCASASLTVLLCCFDLRETKFVSLECHSCLSLCGELYCTRSVHLSATLQLISAHKYTALDNRQYLWGVGGCRWGETSIGDTATYVRPQIYCSGQPPVLVGSGGGCRWGERILKFPVNLTESVRRLGSRQQ